jgi:adenylate kinase
MIKQDVKEAFYMLIIGKPGAGKGTVAEYIQKKYGLTPLSPGNIFRSEIKKGTDLGILAKGLIDKGNFLPDEITIEIIKNALPELTNGYIMDGFPRNTVQARAFEDMLIQSNMHIDLVLHLDIDNEIIYKRLADRQVCPQCQATYHRLNLPSKEMDICDRCKVALVIREDDKPEYMKHRLDVYQEKTEPIIQYYFEKGLIETVQSDCDIDEMLERVTKIMDERIQSVKQIDSLV